LCSTDEKVKNDFDQKIDALAKSIFKEYTNAYENQIGPFVFKNVNGIYSFIHYNQNIKDEGINIVKNELLNIVINGMVVP